MTFEHMNQNHRLSTERTNRQASSSMIWWHVINSHMPLEYAYTRQWLSRRKIRLLVHRADGYAHLLILFRLWILARVQPVYASGNWCAGGMSILHGWVRWKHNANLQFDYVVEVTALFQQLIQLCRRDVNHVMLRMVEGVFASCQRRHKALSQCEWGILAFPNETGICTSPAQYLRKSEGYPACTDSRRGWAHLTKSFESANNTKRQAKSRKPTYIYFRYHAAMPGMWCSHERRTVCSGRP